MPGVSGLRCIAGTYRGYRLVRPSAKGMSGILMEETKWLAITKQEAELIMDSFKVSNPLTRNIALKAAGLVLEFAAEENVRDAQRLTGVPRQIDQEVVR